MNDKSTIENVNAPRQVTNIDAAKFTAIFDAMLTAMSATPMTAQDIKNAVAAHLCQNLFPAGAISGWWAKTGQLDPEATGTLLRHNTKPLSWSIT